MNKTYHHGDLPTALRASAAELVAERGPTGFSLREVARRAGVSHAAPAHHFGGTRGLLTSLAIEGFQALNEAFDAAVAGSDDPVERLGAMGKAYVNTALSKPGHFGVMCNDELVDSADETFMITAAGAYERLVQAVADIRDAYNPDLDVDAAATLAWSTVHGLATLAPGLKPEAAIIDAGLHDELLDRITSLMINGFAAR